MGTQRGAREGTNPDELLVDEGFNAILGGIIQKKFGLVDPLKWHRKPGSPIQPE
jgi:hypothetical protein